MINMKKLTIMRFISENTTLSRVLVTLGALVTTLIGDITPVLVAIFILYCFDWLTGFTASLLNARKGIGSRPLLHGFVKTLIYLVLISISYQFTKIVEPATLHKLALMVSGGIQFLIILCESISVIENLDNICEYFGVTLPILKFIRKFLMKNLIKNKQKRVEGAK